MPAKILLIDDDDMTLYMLEEMLKQDGYEIIKANDGELGFKMYQKEKPDLVFMDLEMPNVDGYTSTSLLKSLNPNIKIVIMTGNDQDQDLVIEMAQLGISNFITKPFEELKIRKTAKRLLAL